MNDPTATDLTELQRLSEALTLRGWAARLVCHLIRGDRDARLHVRGPESGLEAEVLGPYDDAPVGDRWTAVRVTADERILWSGPPRGCNRGELLDFVLDLLRAPSAALDRRYGRLG